MFNTLLAILNLLVIAIGTYLVIEQIKISRNAKFSELWLEAEKDFVELNKLMLTDQALRNTYRLADPVLLNVDDDHLKKFIFYELYYSHLARVHQMFQSPLNPYHGDREADGYWALYKPMVLYYANDPVFLEVHASAKTMRTFAGGFMSEVDAVLKNKLDQQTAAA